MTERGERIREIGRGTAYYVGQGLKYLIGLILLIVVIGGIVLLVLYLGLGERYGGFTETIGKEGLLKVKQEGVPAADRLGFLDGIRFALNPSEIRRDSYTWDSEIIDNEFNEDLGVKITSFEPVRARILDGDRIQMLARIEAGSLKEEGSLVQFSCEMEDYMDPVRTDPGEIIVYPSFAKQIETVNCYFDNGIRVRENRGETSKVTTFSVSYDFTTQSSLRVYFMSLDQLNFYRAHGRNPFEEIDEDLLDRSTNRIRSQSTDGPMDIAINIIESQPLSEESQASFVSVDFKRRSQWSGTFEEMIYFEFRVPQIVEMIDNGYCDFEFTGEIDENNFKVFGLKESALEQGPNVKCDGLKDVSLSDCIRDFKDYFSFGCNFMVDYLPDGDFFFSNFYAKADYVFTAEQKKLVTAFSKPAIDICSDKDEEECLTLKGCRPLYGVDENDYLSCGECPNEFRHCADYGSSKKLCENDSCGLGGDFNICTFNKITNKCEGIAKGI